MIERKIVELTFSDLAFVVSNISHDNDFEMIDELEDYLENNENKTFKIVTYGGQ